MDIKHFIVTCLAVKRSDKQGYLCEQLGMTWEQWVNKSISLMDRLERRSLKNQTSQDFTLLTYVDNRLIKFGKVLKNEVIIPVEEQRDDADQIVQGINDNAKGYDRIIITRLDRDDCLRKDFVKNVRDHFEGGGKGYVDIFHSLSYDIKNKIFYDSDKYYLGISPFVSVMEQRDRGQFRCLPFRVSHGAIGGYVPGIKSRNLYSMQGIHDHNVLNKLRGVKTKINRRDYGL